MPATDHSSSIGLGRRSGQSLFPVQRRRSACSRSLGPAWFRASHLAVSPAARASLELATCSLRPLIDRHCRGDWGRLRGEDARNNEYALIHNGDVISEFELSTGAVLLIITNANRTLTSVIALEEH